MSNLERFEFYNNFDIWYDLYQENGGDSNYVINMMMFSGQSSLNLTYHVLNHIVRNNGVGISLTFSGDGSGTLYHYENKIITGDGDGYICGCGFTLNNKQKMKGNGTF